MLANPSACLGEGGGGGGRWLAMGCAQTCGWGSGWGAEIRRGESE